MITLYGSGPNFGLPDASPFVTKAETLLRMSKLPFEKALMSFSKAPKGTIPGKEIRHRFRPGPHRRATRHRLGVRENGGG